MKILSKKEERKLKRRLFFLTLAIGLSKKVRHRFVTFLINKFSYFDNTAKSGLEFVSPYHERLLIYLKVHSWVERKIISTGYYERELDAFLVNCLKEGHVAFDVGANVGCHTLVMASSVGASGKVLAFEPNPKIYDRLQANIRLNRLTNIELHQVCLGEQKGEMGLFIPKDDYYNQAVATLHRDNIKDECDTVSVSVTTLDVVVAERQLDRIDLIKVDVEGHEYQVFSGARQTIEKYRPIIIFEFSDRQWRNAGYTPEAVEDWLSNLDYELFTIRREKIISIEYGVDERCNILALPKYRK